MVKNLDPILEERLGNGIYSFSRLVYLKHSNSDNTKNYIGKLYEMSQYLANMGQVGLNKVLVYFLISGL